MVKVISKWAVRVTSISCAIHCILAPFIIVLAPALGGFFESFLVEVGLLVISILCGISIIYLGYCKHKKSHALFIYSVGIVLWVIHAVLEHLEIEFFGLSYYIFIGTALVLGSYYMNHRDLKGCADNCCGG